MYIYDNFFFWTRTGRINFCATFRVLFLSRFLYVSPASDLLQYLALRTSQITHPLCTFRRKHPVFADILYMFFFIQTMHNVQTESFHKGIMNIHLSCAFSVPVLSSLFMSSAWLGRSSYRITGQKESVLCFTLLAWMTESWSFCCI
jgi:hypothetical protein